ncbi:MAG: hypothetical protein HKP14_10580 [Bacteroidia bacterium]|nr:hypothetical protein [Bacteroidia bacterium]
MWFSFSTNILIFATALVIYLTMKDDYKQKYFLWFVLLTGIAAGVAAFGHLEVLNPTLQKVLLFISRMVNIASIFSFMTGTFHYFKLIDNKWIKRTNNSAFLFFLCWLGIDNMFLPVTYYGVIGMAIISLGVFVKNLKVNRLATIPVIIGICLIILSALVFYVMNNALPISPADVSHIIIAVSLVVMARGFKNMNLYDISI